MRDDGFDYPFWVHWGVFKSRFAPFLPNSPKAVCYCPHGGVSQLRSKSLALHPHLNELVYCLGMDGFAKYGPEMAPNLLGYVRLNEEVPLGVLYSEVSIENHQL
ncbi:hypothetical protein CASFOL_028822 [Castilleja foliolosa]|uniref:Uncharacterized protein n=1 Tax=Castilleja foliolosa TaxID=1961234 RepID=A0ABD3CDT3_9LAMI